MPAIGIRPGVAGANGLLFLRPGTDVQADKKERQKILSDTWVIVWFMRNNHPRQETYFVVSVIDANFNPLAVAVSVTMPGPPFGRTITSPRP